MVQIRGQSDNRLKAIANALSEYEQAHPDAEIMVYRQNPASVRIRVIDQAFQGVSKADRHENVWCYLQSLSDDELSEISLLLLLKPEEVEGSFANDEFENPVPSAL
jgi:stress-induced morphogen